MVTVADINHFFASLFEENGYNASYQLLAVAYVQVLATSTRSATRKLGWGDNVNPRSTIAEMEKSGKVSPKVLGELKRRQAAHDNSWEMLPMAAAAVLAGNTAGLSARYMNISMLAFVLLRGAFIRLYVSTTRQRQSAIRSALWVVCALSIVTTLFKAGAKLNANRFASV